MTRILRTRAELRAALATRRRPVGLVPTMGWLHDGHRALIAPGPGRGRDDGRLDLRQPAPVQRGRRLHAVPAQRGARPGDLRGRGRRPRLRAAVDEVYPPGFDTAVSVGAIARPLEGAARPGHFDGVATVVAILFGLVGAERAYFGQKDAQQVMVIRQMARDLAIPTEVIACPTVREADGLALSSRNVHLSPGRARRGAGPAPRAAGRRATAGRPASATPRPCARSMRDELADEPLADVDYVSCADGVDARRARPGDGPALLSLAVRFGTTRLIDNEPLVATSAAPPTWIAEACWPPASGSSSPISIFYAALGAAYPFLPVFYRDLGLALDEIGAADRGPGGDPCSSPAPVWGGLSDRFPRSRVTLPLADGGRHGRGGRPVPVDRIRRRRSSASLDPVRRPGRGLARCSTPGRSRRSARRPATGSARSARSARWRSSSRRSSSASCSTGYGPRSLFWVYIPILVADRRRDRDHPAARSTRGRSACGAAPAES